MLPQQGVDEHEEDGRAVEQNELPGEKGLPGRQLREDAGGREQQDGEVQPEVGQKALPRTAGVAAHARPS